MIVDIMDISQEPNTQKELQKWISEVGVDEAFKKIILIHTIYSS